MNEHAGEAGRGGRIWLALLCGTMNVDSLRRHHR